ncbi:testicular haploid expressed gene protein-like [Echinops telfairi]|uniref:Testicular haploid expressed gene protein-like n=1 Tax=Echinops telfairi TaxID=9371 RepID=A0ABM0IRY9_ECHTE|nr:testicular haploid expressed gene protein-like [Echinops telfairi]
MEGLDSSTLSEVTDVNDTPDVSVGSEDLHRPLVLRFFDGSRSAAEEESEESEEAQPAGQEEPGSSEGYEMSEELRESEGREVSEEPGSSEGLEEPGSEEQGTSEGREVSEEHGSSEGREVSEEHGSSEGREVSEEQGSSEGREVSEEHGSSEWLQASEEHGSSEWLQASEETRTSQERGVPTEDEQDAVYLEPLKQDELEAYEELYEPFKALKTGRLGKAKFLPIPVTVSPSLVVRPQPPGLLSLSVGICSSSFTRKRIHSLAKPKKQWGIPERKLLWGNQDPIRPISQSALMARLSKRLQYLANPKETSRHYIPNRSLHFYSCGRNSVIWEIPSAALFSHPSKRLKKLAQPKKCFAPSLRNCKVEQESDSRRATSANIPYASPRILRLSLAKGMDPHYLPPKKIGTKIPLSTLSAVATPRMVDLAHPRIKIEGMCYETGKSEVPVRPVSFAATHASASPRLMTLAKNKSVHPDYIPDREAQWPISYAATHSQVSPRVQELSIPSPRSPVRTAAFELDVFKVKPAAMKAKCSARILELAQPVRR